MLDKIEKVHRIISCPLEVICQVYRGIFLHFVTVANGPPQESVPAPVVSVKKAGTVLYLFTSCNRTNKL